MSMERSRRLAGLVIAGFSVVVFAVFGTAHWATASNMTAHHVFAEFEPEITLVRSGGDFDISGGVYPQLAKVLPEDGRQGDLFGYSVAVDGNTLVIGSPMHDPNQDGLLWEAGAAYVYEFDAGGSGNWDLVTILESSDIQASDRFGISVAVDNDTIVVGAYGEDGGPGDPVGTAGAAYVFERNEGGAENWGEVKKLTSDNPLEHAYFGISVAIDQDTIVIGASGEDSANGNLVFAGAVFIFSRGESGSGSWEQSDKLNAGDPAAGVYFGRAVAVNGHTIVVGANEEGVPTFPEPDTGSAYIFYRENGVGPSWVEVKKLFASDAQAGDHFGRSVAISIDTVVIGAESEDGGPGNPSENAGAAYIFERNFGGADLWGETKKLTPVGAISWDSFGVSVGIDVDTIAIGAWLYDPNLPNQVHDGGAGFIYSRNLGGMGEWNLLDRLTAEDEEANDRFGYSVSVGGDMAVFGSIGEDGGAGNPIEDVGAAYLFQRIQLNEKAYLPLVVSEPETDPTDCP